MNKLFLSAALAIGITGSAFAAAANSDLIIGFRDTTGAITTSYELDLGQVSNFVSPTYSTLTEVINLNSVSGTKLSTWAGSSTTINAAIFGTNGSTSTTGVLFGSSKTTTSLLDGSASAIAYASNSTSFQQAGGASAIAGLYGTGTPAPFAANTGYAVANTNAKSYNAIFTKTTGGLTAFSPKSSLEATFGSSSPIVWDLYQLNPTDQSSVGTVFLGTFALYSSGDLKFIAAAVPEPSTYAAILGAMVLGFVAIRRRLVKA